MTRWKAAAAEGLVNNGMSLTTTAPLGAAARSSAKRARIAGWVIASNRRRADGSANTIDASAPRSRDPSDRRTPVPNSSTTAASPSVPGATTSRASRSESTTTAPRAASRPDTVDLPAPMPPVTATVTVMTASSPPPA